MAAIGTTQLPGMNQLREDCTHPAGGLMGAKRVVAEMSVVSDPRESRRAQHAMADLVETEEIRDDGGPGEIYWRAFQTAERRLEA